MRHLRTRLTGMLRASAALLAVGGLAALLLTFVAQARADRLARGMGEMLLSLNPDREGEPVAMQLNGLPLWIRSGHSTQPLGRVLDELEARCRAVSGLRDLLPAPPLAPDALAPVLRREDGQRGYVACLDLGPEPLDTRQLLRRIDAFGETGDLAQLGGLRLAFARADGQGTHHVSVWSDGPLPLLHAFPASGDAPGVDPVGMPRPPEARRVLSAGVGGDDGVLASYHSDLAPTRLLSRYRAQLETAGMAVLADAGGRALLVQSVSASRVVAITPDAGGCVLSLATLP